jgi:hypothetical protein
MPDEFHISACCEKQRQKPDRERAGSLLIPITQNGDDYHR